MKQLPFLIQMRTVAREARSRGRRCSYTPELKEQGISFLDAVEAEGGSLEDAAEMMAMHRQTLEGWVDVYTRPEPRDLHIHIHG